MRDLFDSSEIRQRVQSRENHVVRIGRAKALGKNVRDATALHDSAYCATSDHTSAWRCRLHENASGTMLAHDRVRDRAARHRNRNHATTRCFDSLAHRFGNLIGLTGREADASLPVANSDECVEGETATTLHDLCDTVDSNHVLDEIAALAALATASAVTSALTATASGTTATRAALTATILTTLTPPSTTRAAAT